jgi:hypothetical protein
MNGKNKIEVSRPNVARALQEIKDAGHTNEATYEKKKHATRRKGGRCRRPKGRRDEVGDKR